MRKQRHFHTNGRDQITKDNQSFDRKQKDHLSGPKQSATAATVHTKENFAADGHTTGKQRQRPNHGHQQQRNKSLVSKSWQCTPQSMPIRHMQPQSRRSYDGSSGTAHPNYHDPSSFVFYIGTADEAICAQRAQGTMNMFRELVVEPIPELLNVYIASDDVLRRCAQDYMDVLEESKAKATEAWLQARPEAEQEMYRQRISWHAAARGGGQQVKATTTSTTSMAAAAAATPTTTTTTTITTTVDAQTQSNFS